MRYISFFFIWALASLVRIEETVGTDWPCPALASEVFFSHIWDNRILDNTIFGLFPSALIKCTFIILISDPG